MFEHEVILHKVLNYKFHLFKFIAKNQDFKFRIGQFVLIDISDNIKRAYSIASTPATLPYWEIFVDITPGGPGTTYLKSLKKGDLIQTSSPSGQFILGNKANNYLFGATGCGIAPFIPMIDTLLINKKQVSLFWGLRKQKDIALKNNLFRWRKNKHFTYEIILSRPEKTWKGKSGHINYYLLNKAKSYPRKDFAIYLSGSRQFISEATTLLKQSKIPAKAIFFEACY